MIWYRESCNYYSVEKIYCHLYLTCFLPYRFVRASLIHRSRHFNYSSPTSRGRLIALRKLSCNHISNYGEIKNSACLLLIEYIRLWIYSTIFRKKWKLKRSLPISRPFSFIRFSVLQFVMHPHVLIFRSNRWQTILLRRRQIAIVINKI